MLRRFLNRRLVGIVLAARRRVIGSLILLATRRCILGRLYATCFRGADTVCRIVLTLPDRLRAIRVRTRLSALFTRCAFRGMLIAPVHVLGRQEVRVLSHPDKEEPIERIHLAGDRRIQLIPDPSVTNDRLE